MNNSTYSELLKSEKWINKRTIILERDKYTCQKNGCQNTFPKNFGKCRGNISLVEYLVRSDGGSLKLLNKIIK